MYPSLCIHVSGHYVKLPMSVSHKVNNLAGLKILSRVLLLYLKKKTKSYDHGH